MTKQGEWEQMFQNSVVLNVYHSFLVVLHLCGCTSSSLVVVSGGYSLVVSRILITVASLVEEHWC